MTNVGRHVSALAGVLVLGLSVSVTARGDSTTEELTSDARVDWYWGVGIHGLSSDGEHDGDIVTDLDFLGPRLYGGRRISEHLSVEAEIGQATFQGDLWSGRLSTDLRMWNAAVTAVFHIPWENSLVEPLLYAGIGRSFWDYEVTGRTSDGPYRFVDSSSDVYWHVGAGVQIPLTERIAGRVGYRYWRANMRPRPNRWAVNPDDYSYRRQGIELALQWRF